MPSSDCGVQILVPDAFLDQYTPMGLDVPIYGKSTQREQPDFPDFGRSSQDPDGCHGWELSLIYLESNEPALDYK